MSIIEVGAEAGGPGVGDCWNRIGVNGDGSCPELATHVHCRNCPVFARAARGFFERRAPEGYLQEWAELLARPAEAGPGDSTSLLVFRLGREWLAMALSVVAEVTSPRPVHRVPHRTNRVFSGLVGLPGRGSSRPLRRAPRQPPPGGDPPGRRILGVPGRGGGGSPARPPRPDGPGSVDPVQPGRELQPGRLRLGRGAERRRPRRAPGL